MKKIYTIEITSNVTRSKWYSNREGDRFEAELVIKSDGRKDSGVVSFKISDVLFIPPLHCKVVDERVEETN